MKNPQLEMRVHNLGPIKRASLNLKPLTVLIGKNNTGKTYLAQTLYAIYKSIEKVRPGVNADLTEQEIRMLRNAMLHLEYEDQFHLPKEIVNKAHAWVRQGFLNAGSELENRLKASFGIRSIGDIARWDQDKSVSIELLQHHSNKRKYLFGSLEGKIPAIPKITEIEIDITKSELFNLISFLRESLDEQARFHYSRELAWILAREVWIEYLGDMDLYKDVHYLPAGRSGLLAAWTDVVKLHLELERERFGLIKRPDTSLGGIALDFISTLSEIISSNPHRSRLNSQLELFHEERQRPEESLHLLQQLMGGKVFAGTDEDRVPTLEYREGKHEIPVQRASSMVADLAPLAMWVEHLLLDGDVLIIDEPESHLHPSSIRLVARVLVRLVNEGVNVVCATHSPVLLHELSNCILRAQLYTDGYLDNGYSVNDCLSLDSVAVHRFVRSRSDNSVIVKPVDIDPEWGIPEDEYVEVAKELSDDSIRLFDYLSS